MDLDAVARLHKLHGRLEMVMVLAALALFVFGIYVLLTRLMHWGW